MEDRLIETLEDCDQRWYYIFSQDFVRTDDFSSTGTPKLRNGISSAERSRVIEIPEVAVMGDLSALSIRTRLEKSCSAKGKKSVDCKCWSAGVNSGGVVADLNMLYSMA